MKAFGLDIRRSSVEKRESLESPTVAISSESVLAFFGQEGISLPRVTIESALTVPAVIAAVAFLSRTLAALPLHAFRDGDDGDVKLKGKLQTIVHDAPNDQMSSFAMRQYFWQQVFTGGRGLAWIERNGASVEAIWPMVPAKTTLKRVGWRTVYRYEGQDYAAEDVIDIPFMLRSNQLGHHGPVMLAGKAIQLALAMNAYASNFFAGGGVPPLSLSGPLPQGADGLKRAMDDVHRAIDAARKTDKPVFPMPPGYKLEQVGYDPAKGQMTEARLFQIQEIARAWQLPPVFLQDLSRASFTNAEQQDLHLVKHLIAQWAKALEGEMSLKLFGRGSKRRVEHNLDGLMRGDFKSRIEGLTRGVQGALLTPNEGRALENRPRHANPAADELLVQGATVVLGTAALKSPPADPSAADANANGGAHVQDA